MPTVLKLLGALYLFLNYLFNFSIVSLIEGILVFILFFYAGQLLKTLYNIRDKIENIESSANKNSVQDQYAGKIMIALNDIKDLLQRNKMEE